MDKTLKLWFFDGQQDMPFPWGSQQAELLEFSVNASRMGAAPTISGTLEYPTCLDGVWAQYCNFDDVFVEFKGEKYYLKTTPSSSKSNDKTFYKHENLNFVSERIVLENVYVIDDVNNQTDNILFSNNTQMSFFGDIHAFAERINQAMYFAGVGDTCMYDQNGDLVPIGSRVLNNDGYYIVVDSGITSEEVSINFSNSTFSDALKNVFDKFGIPYYFVGKVIHIGNFEYLTESTPRFVKNGVLGAGLSSGNLVPYEYGNDKAALSVNRTNSTKQIYNRCSGTGSEDNLPFYYPNPSQNGEIAVEADRDNHGDAELELDVPQKLAEKCPVGGFIKCLNSNTTPQNVQSYMWCEGYSSQGGFHPNNRYVNLPETLDSAVQGEEDFMTTDVYYEFKIKFKGNGIFSFKPVLRLQNPLAQGEDSLISIPFDKIISGSIYSGDVWKGHPELYPDDFNIETGISKQSDCIIINVPYYSDPNSYNDNVHSIILTYKITEEMFESVMLQQTGSVNVALNPNFGSDMLFSVNGSTKTSDIHSLSSFGLRVDSGTVVTSDKWWETLVKYVHPQPKLMPSCYRASDGIRRFYPARNYPLQSVSANNWEIDPYLGDEVINDTLENDNYKEPNSGGVYYHFDNPYRRMKQKEHIEDFPDIKPSIEGMTNSDGRRIDMFAAIAFDTNDDNSLIDDENGNAEYKHPYFFAKLRRFDGSHGFNMFDYAIDEGEMTIAMTSGDCAPCEFIIGVDEETGKNTVQVDSSGNLVRDADGNVLCGRKGQPQQIPQDRQNDTENYEVWVALKKDINTYGDIMPFNASPKVIRPKAVISYGSDNGDTFVILHIAMPQAYVLAAEDKLTEEIIKFMFENNSEKFNLTLKYSRAFLGENQGLVDLLSENVKVQARYNGVSKQFFVSSFTYNMNPQYSFPEITISGLVETIDELKANSANNNLTKKITQSVVASINEAAVYSHNPVVNIINQSSSTNQQTTSDKTDQQSDCVKSYTDLDNGRVVVGVGGKVVRGIQNGEEGQVLATKDGYPTWVDAEELTEKPSLQVQGGFIIMFNGVDVTNNPNVNTLNASTQWFGTAEAYGALVKNNQVQQGVAYHIMVNPDWNETDPTSLAFIKNKPDIMDLRCVQVSGTRYNAEFYYK